MTSEGANSSIEPEIDRAFRALEIDRAGSIEHRKIDRSRSIFATKIDHTRSSAHTGRIVRVEYTDASNQSIQVGHALNSLRQPAAFTDDLRFAHARLDFDLSQEKKHLFKRLSHSHLIDPNPEFRVRRFGSREQHLSSLSECDEESDVVPMIRASSLIRSIWIQGRLVYPENLKG
ncbi:unnamed protein product [Caenorhabditis bovis]|uniref:Uncharacterized protein n=1 Tax=Caenorhabditis bovis TaxID=2654633 RepID=A0A8S1EL07_9PELO|nr:unnamed protein product [Caenorhabditis bovis]